MIRVLTMIAVAGFVLSVGSLAAAFAIGGPDIVARGGWNIASGGWDHDWSHWSDHEGDAGEWAVGGPKITRTIPWSGAAGLDVNMSADVRYIQSPGPGSVEVTGPQRAVDNVTLRGSNLGYDHGRRHRHYPKLSIVVRAPNVQAFDISGRSTLAIEGYRQERLSLDVSGDSEVTATGEAERVSVDVSGSGDVDLGGLKTRGASADVSGASDVTLAPTEWAELEVSGVGDIRLLTRPARLETDISGGGKVRQDEGSAPPSPSASPSPSPSPSPPPKAPKP